MKLKKCDFHIPFYQSYYTLGVEYTSWPHHKLKTNEEKALRLSWGGVHQTEEPKESPTINSRKDHSQANVWQCWQNNWQSLNSCFLEICKWYQKSLWEALIKQKNQIIMKNIMHQKSEKITTNSKYYHLWRRHRSNWEPKIITVLQW